LKNKGKAYLVRQYLTSKSVEIKGVAEASFVESLFYGAVVAKRFFLLID
jgi:hypothetical protein